MQRQRELDDVKRSKAAFVEQHPVVARRRRPLNARVPVRATHARKSGPVLTSRRDRTARVAERWHVAGDILHTTGDTPSSRSRSLSAARARCHNASPAARCPRRPRPCRTSARPCGTSGRCGGDAPGGARHTLFTGCPVRATSCVHCTSKKERVRGRRVPACA